MGMGGGQTLDYTFWTVSIHHQSRHRFVDIFVFMSWVGGI